MSYTQLVDICSDAVGLFSLLTSIFYHQFGGVVFAMLCVAYSVSSTIIDIRKHSRGMIRPSCPSQSLMVLYI